MPGLKSVSFPNILFLLLTLIGPMIILATAIAPIYDQDHLVQGLVHTYPNIDAGITSMLISKFFYSLSPGSSLIQHNTVLRLFAFIFYFGSAFLLGRSVFSNPAFAAIFIWAIFISKYPFLWLSSELFAGAFLCLFLWSIHRKMNPFIAGALLAGFSLCKPDILLPGLGMWIFYSWMQLQKGEQRTATRFSLAFLGSLLILILPAAVLYKSNIMGARSIFSFGQHYAVLFAPHQIMKDAPEPWTHYGDYFNAIFPNTQSMTDVITRYPKEYIDFIALSIAKGVRKGSTHFPGWILLIAFIEFKRRKLKLNFDLWAPSELQKLICVSLIGILPWILFSSPHIRYMARYFPVVVLLALATFEQLFKNQSSKTAFKFLGVIVLIHTVIGFKDIVRPQSGTLNWFPAGAVFWFPD